MNLRHLIGTILVLSSILCSCIKVDTDPMEVRTNVGTVYVREHSFGFGETKATKSFNWERGDQVCIYSLVMV